VLSNANLPDADNNGTPDFIEANAPAAALEFITGISGGPGCSIIDGKPSKFDPLLLLLAGASVTFLRRRRPEHESKNAASL